MYPDTFLPEPLSTPEFYTLFALSHGEGYAYNLRSRVLNDSLGSVRMAGGTLYPALARLQAQDLIEYTGYKPAGKSEISRKHYVISEEGRLRLQEELSRLHHVVRMAEAAGLLNDATPIDIQRLLLEARLQAKTRGQ